VTLTGGNRNDITQLIPLVDAIPPIRGRRGRPRRKPNIVVADRGYDHDKYRVLLRQRGIRPLISRRGTRDNNQPARWVVEQTLALLHQFRRLAERWERRTDIHHGFSPSPPASSAGAASEHQCVRSSKPSEPDLPTPAGAAKLAEEAFRMNDDWGTLVWLVRTTGIRRGELCALRSRESTSTRALLTSARTGSEERRRTLNSPE
jgi:transposase